MEHTTAEALAREYLAIVAGNDDPAPALARVLSADVLDHVSGRRGREMWAMVIGWIRSSFADMTVEIHDVMTREDRVMVWATVTGTHIGGGLPRLSALPVTGERISWPQVHVFRVEGELLVEHWAVRDDYAAVEQIVGGGPLAAPRPAP